jgi:NADPH-dependent 2,4-dienoyl-CoA reductase/sulfur reductase-like enzyme/rhodanese-related sulfurtransferase
MGRYLIIGGVAGGATAAARLRRLDEKSEIILFERGEYISYANCGLPYYLGNVITSRNRLFVRTPPAFGKRYNIDIRITSDVISINRPEKSVTVKNLSTGETYTEKYDKLILSPGAEPVRPPIPGIEGEGIFTLRNVNDTDRIKEYCVMNKVASAVIVGAGFIGLEMAENFHSLGMKVSVIETFDQVMPLFDYEMAAMINQHLMSKDVDLYLKDSAVSFSRKGKVTAVTLKSGAELTADVVIISVGVRPDSKLAVVAGLAVGERNAITVNEHLQTSDENIYAMGDAIEFMHPILKRHLPAYLAGPANKQARVAADNIVLGNKFRYSGTIGTAIARVFDLTAAITGLSEKALRREKMDFESTIIHGSSHATYYPDSMPVSIKLLFTKGEGKILGAQAVGYDGVDKRIDVIASVMKNGGTVYDLADFEHAYAPPYSSAKDPVNMAGFTAENILTGKMKAIGPFELMEAAGGNDFILDVREKSEHASGHIGGSLNIPLDDLRSNLGKIPKGKRIVVYCASGLRSYLASRILVQSGFEETYNLKGGYTSYSLAEGRR